MGSYAVVTACGKQKNSLKPTAGSFSFGTASRDQHNKVFLTKQLAKKQIQSCSPGPVYAHITSIGTSTPTYRFGTAAKLAPTRDPYGECSLDVASANIDSQKLKYSTPSSAVFGYELRESKNAAVVQSNPQTYLGLNSPGPTAYLVKDAYVFRTPRGTSFANSCERKIVSARDKGTPSHVGPGTYPTPRPAATHSHSFGRALRPGQTDVNRDGIPVSNARSSMGRQLSSRKKTAGVCNFGSATREKADKTFLVQTSLDKGTQQATRCALHHPVLDPEPDRIKYS